MRPGTAGAGRALEWGQDTDQPGSRVRDVDGRPIFTGSKVVLVTGGTKPRPLYEVVELVDVHHVRVTKGLREMHRSRADIWRVVS